MNVPAPGKLRVLLSAVACFAVFAAPTVAQGKALSLDDMLEVEGFGAAVIDPVGRWLIFERIRPYDEITDYSFRTYAFAKSGHQLWRYDLLGHGKPELLPGIAPEPHSYLQGFSPSGGHLAVMQYEFGQLSLGAYDLANGTLVKFAPTPAFDRAGEHNPVWISNEEMVFTALPEGAWPLATSVRAYTGKMLSRMWNEAWRGTSVTANEVRTTAADDAGGQEEGRLVRANVRNASVETLANGLHTDLRVSPDGRWLAALAVSKPRAASRDTLIEGDLRRYTFSLYDLRTNERRRLAPELEFFPYTITWSPDGRRVAAFGWAPDQDPREGRFHVIDITTGEVVRYEHSGLDLVSERERGWLQRPERAVFLGDRLAVFARQITDGESQDPRFSYRSIGGAGLPRSDWYALARDGSSINLTRALSPVSGVPIHSGSNHLTVAAEDGVYRLYADREPQRLTPDLPGAFQYIPPGTFATRSGVIRPEFTDEALLSVTGPGAARLVMVDLREGQEGHVAVVEAPTRDAIPLAGGLAAGAVLFRAEDGPVSRLMLGATGQGLEPVDLDSANARLAEVDFGTWKIVTYEVEDPEGLMQPHIVQSCILLPPGVSASQPPPLIVDVYPGVGANCTTGGPAISYPDPYSPYLWAGKGYAYARLAAPRELIRTADGPIAGLDEVIEAGVAALVSEKLVDPDRMALHGLSQGGVSALYVAAHSTMFKAVIAQNSWADFFSHYFGGTGMASNMWGDSIGIDAARYDSVSGSDFGIGRTPFDDPEVYYRNSPVFLAPQINAPVLLIHSDMDAFAISQFDEMFGALKRSEKDARYVRYWGEGHGLSSPANIRDLWRRLDQFLETNGVSP